MSISAVYSIQYTVYSIQGTFSVQCTAYSLVNDINSVQTINTVSSRKMMIAVVWICLALFVQSKTILECTDSERIDEIERRTGRDVSYIFVTPDGCTVKFFDSTK